MDRCTYKSVVKNSSVTCSPPVMNCSSTPSPRTLSPRDELELNKASAKAEKSKNNDGTSMLVLAGVGVGGALAVLIVLGLVYGSQSDRRAVPDAWLNSVVGDPNDERLGVTWLNEADEGTEELELTESNSESVFPGDRKASVLY
ncbi:hypothetical protein DIPPA_06024 [Diplonema papillatum]|nr:hypothetical protein DIPPA_06024 [Diplonema papillatum]